MLLSDKKMISSSKRTGVSRRAFTTRQMTLSAIMAAVICILGPLSIPIPVSPVPITLTNLAIYFTVCILGWKLGTVSYLIYLVIGLAGLPVFSSFGAGFGKLLGPTGGYLIGFIFMAIICGLFFEKTITESFYSLASFWVLWSTICSARHGWPYRPALPSPRPCGPA